jgi:hypothetical protein
LSAFGCRIIRCPKAGGWRSRGPGLIFGPARIALSHHRWLVDPTAQDRLRDGEPALLELAPDEALPIDLSPGTANVTLCL